MKYYAIMKGVSYKPRNSDGSESRMIEVLALNILPVQLIYEILATLIMGRAIYVRRKPINA